VRETKTHTHAVCGELASGIEPGPLPYKGSALHRATPATGSPGFEPGAAGYNQNVRPLHHEPTRNAALLCQSSMIDVARKARAEARRSVVPDRESNPARVTRLRAGYPTSHHSPVNWGSGENRVGVLSSEVPPFHEQASEEARPEAAGSEGCVEGHYRGRSVSIISTSCTSSGGLSFR
jgi:hypothetical protein